MFRKVLRAANNNVILNVDMTEITHDNVRYWWRQVSKQRYERDSDPWKSAVVFLKEQPDVIVHSYIHQRRRYFCWYFPQQFNIDLVTVTEVYIDSTWGMNGQNTELFAIIACEDGYGVPIGYMLIEKMPTDDSRKFPGEVIDTCTHFFSHAKELGLIPIIVHIDKCTAEIAAIKVFSSFVSI